MSEPADAPERQPLADDEGGSEQESQLPPVLRVQVLPAAPGPSSLPLWRYGMSGDLAEPLHPGGPLSSSYGPASVPYCCKWNTFTSWVSAYLLALLVVGLLGAYATPTTAIVLLAFLPNIFLLSYLTRTYRHCVLVKQGVATFLEATLIMCPLVIAENLWNFIFFSITKLPQQVEPTDRRFDSPLYVLSALVMSYTVAGFFEEMVKYLAVRRILYHPHLTDPRAVVVYAAFAGSAFEVVENLTVYDLSFGLGTSVFRALLPLHAVTAMISGLYLAEKKFNGYKERWYVTILLPVAVHGSFDFLLSVVPYPLLSTLIGFVIVLVAFRVVRRDLNKLSTEFPVEQDVHMAVASGFVDKSAVPTLRYITLLAILAPLTSLLFVAVISQLVPKQSLAG